MNTKHRRDMQAGSITDSPNIGADYEPDEVEFMMAMDRYKREHRRPFPTWAEVLTVFKELGYAKSA